MALFSGSDRGTSQLRSFGECFLYMATTGRKDACYKKYASKMKNSARRSRLIAKCRKKKGIKRKGKAGASLKRWQKEKWKNLEDGKPCGRSKGQKTVKCRPSKRVSSKTPKTSKEMTKSEKKKAIRKKRKVGMGRKAPTIKRRKTKRKTRRR